MKILRQFLVWLGIFGIMFSGVAAGTLKAQAKVSISDEKVVEDELIGTPTFSSPDKDNVYFDGDRITILADYQEKGLNVTADVTVIDKSMSQITPLIEKSDGVYKLKTLRLSGTSLITGSDVAICFTAQDEAGHQRKDYSTYLVTTKLHPENPGSDLEAPANLKVTPGDGQVQLFWDDIVGAKKIVISYNDENNIPRQMIVSSKFNDAIIRNLKNGFTYTFTVAGRDKFGLVGKSATISGTPVAPVVVNPEEPEILAATTVAEQPVTVKPAISTGISTKKQVVEAPKQETVEVPSQIAQVQPNDNPPSSKTNWNKLLLAISILIIAAGAACGGYYGYEWYVSREESKPQGPGSKSRW